MRRLRTGTSLALAVAVGAGWYSFQDRAVPKSEIGRSAAAAGTPVGLATVAKGDIPIVVRGLGTVTALNTVNVKTQITGQLIKVDFEEGQDVNKGDLLAVVDPRPYDVALQQAIGQMQKDEALLKNAQTDLERYKKLVAQDSIARQQYDTQVALVRQYEAALVIDQAQVDAAKLNVTYTKIVAPLTGRIGLRFVDPGNYVTMADATNICSIVQVQPISVIFTIPEDRLPQIRQRLKTRASLEARALDRARKTELAVGRLNTHDNVIDITTGTVKLRAVFDNKDETLFPNQFVNVRLLVDTMKDTTVVPIAAIQRGQPGTFVYVARDDDTVAMRLVKLGVTDGDNQQILTGLQVGEQVVVDGTDRLRDGARIRRPNSAPNTATGPPGTAAPPDGHTAQEGQGRPQTSHDDAASPPGGAQAAPQRRRPAGDNGSGAGGPGQTKQ